MASENKTAVVQLRLPPRLKTAAQRAARAESRSLTSLVEHLLVKHLVANGHLPKDSRKPR